MSPRVWSPGSGAKKQGEDLADNDGDEDEGIWGLQGAAAGAWHRAPPLLNGEKPRLSVCSSVGVFLFLYKAAGPPSLASLAAGSSRVMHTAGRSRGQAEP